MREHDQAMKPEIRRFAHDVQPVAVLRREHRLGRLFADFFQNCILTSGQQTGHIGCVCIAALTRFDGAGDAFKRLAHSFFHRFP